MLAAIGVARSVVLGARLSVGTSLRTWGRAFPTCSAPTMALFGGYSWGGFRVFARLRDRRNQMVAAREMGLTCRDLFRRADRRAGFVRPGGDDLRIGRGRAPNSSSAEVLLS